MILKYLLAATVALSLAAPASAQTVTAGIQAWQRADYAGAVRIWRPLADRGDPDAQFNLGQAYRLGRGVPIDLALAKGWLEKAAMQSHVEAETTLGLLLFQNGDQASALKWLKRASEAGEPRAMLVYGTALFNGDNITRDPVAGYAYIYRASAQGLPAARDILGQIDKLLNPADRKRAIALAQAQDKSVGKAMFDKISSPNPGARQAKSKKAAPPAKLPVQVAAVPAPKPEAKASSAKVASAATGPASGTWRIQVGAFNDRPSAEAAYRKLAGNAALAGRSPQYTPFNQFIRLRIGPFASKASAAAACGALHTACYPVAPGQ